MADPAPGGNGMSRRPPDADARPEGRIRITVPETYRKVDESVWEELETYIFQGFLTASAVVSGKTFVFKTMNALEVRNVNFVRPVRGVSPEGGVQFKPVFIAYSVFMVDGVNVLYERPRHVNRLIKTVSRMPPRVQDKILENLSALNQRATRLLPLAEPYCYENRSRYRWLQIRDIPVHSPLATGIPGTDELGMNQSQQMWSAMNRVIDRRDDMERDWQNAKFVGSCMAGKGIRSIDEKDRMRLEKERVDREDLKMKVLHAYLNRKAGTPDPPQKVQLPDGRWAEVSEGNQLDGKWRADSAEELAEQLEAALAGEKDRHDLVIEAKEREMRERAKAIEAHQRSFFQRPPVPSGRDAGPEGRDQTTRVVGGRAEADAYLQRMQALQAEQLKRSRRQPGQDAEGFDEAGNPDGRSEDGQ